MSFSSDIKSEIINASFKNPCCRRAFIFGVYSAKGYNDGEYTLCRTENAEKATFLSEYIEEIYGHKPEPIKNKSGGRGVLLGISSPSLRKYIDGIDGDAPITYIGKCPYCHNAFCKGVFFASGRITDPEKQFSLEISLGSRAPSFNEFFEEQGISLKTTKRKEETILYTKNSSQIEDFFTLADMQSAVFKLMNLKIRNSYLNYANRRRNFDTVNISKAVDTAKVQTDRIKKLEKKGLLNSLPPELESAARLRLANPTMSMAQLAQNAIPVISKSGLKHRMDRLMKLIDEILAKTN